MGSGGVHLFYPYTVARESKTFLAFNANSSKVPLFSMTKSLFPALTVSGSWDEILCCASCSVRLSRLMIRCSRQVSGAVTVMTRSISGYEAPDSKYKGTAYTKREGRRGGRSASISLRKVSHRARILGCRICSSFSRLLASLKMISPNFFLFRVPSCDWMEGPKVESTSVNPGEPGVTTSLAKESASTTLAPHEANRFATVDFPEAIPPVSATVSRGGFERSSWDSGVTLG